MIRIDKFLVIITLGVGMVVGSLVAALKITNLICFSLGFGIVIGGLVGLININKLHRG